MSSFDRRVVPEKLLDLARAIQGFGECHLGGGAALSGVWLRHRRTADIDLFCHDREIHREIVRTVEEAARQVGLALVVVRDGGTFARARVTLPEEPERQLDVDLVWEPAPDLEAPPAPVEGIAVESLTDLRASKLTCLLSRAEPRDLVDVLFLERRGFVPESDLPAALRKDGGIDPGVLAWLLRDFPIRPLPMMLEPLSVDELRAYRDALAERFRRLAAG